MARIKKKIDRREMSISPERAAMLKGLCLHGLIGCLFAGALGAGFYYVKEYVDNEVVMATEPPTIIIKNKPHWMSEFLVQRIAATARPAGLHSAFDHEMLVKRARHWKPIRGSARCMKCGGRIAKSRATRLRLIVNTECRWRLVKWGASILAGGSRRVQVAGTI